MMTRCYSLASLLVVAVATADRSAAHCQVPCGIYTDQLRFEQMLEDTETIAKAIAQIGELSGTHDPTGHNQLARWVVTKEDHASHIQEIIAQYFLTQRIQPDAENYVVQLKAAHKVMVAAMKTKQAADPATTETLQKAILDLYRAYEGKEPQFGAAEAAAASVAATLGHAHPHGAHDHAE